MDKPKVGDRVIYRHQVTLEDFPGIITQIHPGFQNPVAIRLDDENQKPFILGTVYYNEEPTRGRWRYE